MMPRTRFPRVFIFACVLIALALPAFSTQATKQLASGVSLYQNINTDPEAALITTAVTIDPKDPAVTLKAAVGQDIVYVEDAVKGRETISSLTERRGALLGINADFFPFTGDPLGTCVIDGELVSEPAANKRATLCVMKDRTVVFDNPSYDAKLTLASGVSRQIDGINRQRETNQVVAYTPMFGASTRNKYKGTDIVLKSDELPVKAGKAINLTVTDVLADATNTPIPAGGMVLSAGGPAASFLKENLKPGDKLSVQFDVKSSNGVDWTQVEQAVGGAPFLLKDGKQFVDYAEEGFDASFSTTHHPRSAAGVTADGKLMLVTVDGRQSISKGISLNDLSALMKQLGCVNAINLDGGGSTTMSYRGTVLNSPSGGDQRPVADALLVFADPIALPDLPKLQISGPESDVAADQGGQLLLTWGDDSQMLTADQLDHVVWGTTNGSGFINQKGYLTPIRAKQGTVKAFYGQQVVSLRVKVVAGAPAKLDIELIPDKLDPRRAQVSGSLADINSNAVPGKTIKLTITGGKADAETCVTDDKGDFSTGITWDADADVRIARANIGNLESAVALSQKKADR